MCETKNVYIYLFGFKNKSFFKRFVYTWKHVINKTSQDVHIDKLPLAHDAYYSKLYMKGIHLQEAYLFQNKGASVWAMLMIFLTIF